MSKFKKTILMLYLTLLGMFCYASGVYGTENERDGRPVSIELPESTGCGGSDRSSSINPIINGHVLFVAFIENLGQVTVEISTAAGAIVGYTSVLTPNGLQIYIPNAGNYIVTFTLSNGDVYAGEFTVTD